MSATGRIHASARTRPSGASVAAGGSFHADRMSRSRRAAVVTASLAAVCAVLFVTSMTVGSVLLPPLDVLASALGFGDPATDFIVRGLRMPRAITAVLVGLALGASGSIFQRLLRNPLAAPDLIGISAGASTATVAGITVLGLTGVGLSAAAVAGGLGVAALVFLLAWRGGLAGTRFILVGVGVAACCESITSFLIARADITDARAAMTWLVGSAGMASATDLLVLAVAIVVLLPAAAAWTRRLGVLELGGDRASSLGLRVERDTVVLLGIAVVLVALATAAAGPIAFVALMAGPISARLLGRAGDRVLAAALAGAIIVQVADLIAQHALPTPISTGIVTGLVGAPYIAWLLIRAGREGGA
ncbi:FecCD family ABC transporter permease [Agromyces larvae]|uniref:Iron chelate uptake ABC transporter family permease subunit n=1 Tax=Agromyces larvae TaxID=2929802 RepID=A0ABY4C308_9MICO|nr:iron chelate uptake ABC transporter family permease subunit [Agromyces larvae]UOE45832.1 iron chelate uptake ABC transporter family permease subunit [Agromyces larvae]